MSNNLQIITMQYRKDIQILRGIAVFFVVMFHLNITGFQGGFLGVDIFFVVSGYLMAKLYTENDVIGFLSKRAHRLLPAYFATIALTLLASLIIVTPIDFEEVAEQAYFATFFTSNIGFWFETSYFEKGLFQPLLHLWSIGVEIQFYLLIPLMHWLFKRAKYTSVILLICSALLCFYLVSISPKTSFFLMPTRLWEFLAGYGIATIGAEARLSLAKHRNLGGLALVLLIVLPFHTITGLDLSFVYGHPGLTALFIVVLTSLILGTGLPSAFEKNPIADLLETIGKYSYSIYLVHFPVLVLFLYQPFSGNILNSSSWLQLVNALFLIGFLSAALYLLVEKPFRKNKFSLWYFLAPIAVLLFIPVMGILALQQKTSPQELTVFSGMKDRDTFRCGKLMRISNPSASVCELTENKPNRTGKILLIGNSHADSIKQTFVETAERYNYAVFFMVRNSSLALGGVSAEFLIDLAVEHKVDKLAVHFAPQSNLLPGAIEELVDRAREVEIDVAYLLPVPVWEQHVPQTLWENITRNKALPEQTQTDYAKQNYELISQLTKINSANLQLYKTDEVFCKPNCAMASEEGVPYYFDTGHLTLTGSRLLQPVFDQIMQDFN